MLKLVLSMVVLFSLSQAAGSDYYRANAVAKDAFKGLDCEFDDCPKEEVKPKVVEKIVYKDRPVEVEKVVEVEKIVEKVIYRDRPAPVIEPEEPSPVVKVQEDVTNDALTYNKAFFDVHAKSQAPMLDFITYTPRASFNVAQFVDTVSKIKEEYTKVYIHGSIQVPDSITTDEVYINAGEKYYYGYYSYWKKEIYYNGSTTRQNSDYFLVGVKKDASGVRYVDYKIYILLEYPWKIDASEENVAPNTFHFSMAPKVRGFKEKFVPAKIFIKEDS